MIRTKKLVCSILIHYKHIFFHLVENLKTRVFVSLMINGIIGKSAKFSFYYKKGVVSWGDWFNFLPILGV